MLFKLFLVDRKHTYRRHGGLPSSRSLFAAVLYRRVFSVFHLLSAFFPRGYLGVSPVPPPRQVYAQGMERVIKEYHCRSDNASVKKINKIHVISTGLGSGLSINSERNRKSSTSSSVRSFSSSISVKV